MEEEYNRHSWLTSCQSLRLRPYRCRLDVTGVGYCRLRCAKRDHLAVEWFSVLRQERMRKSGIRRKAPKEHRRTQRCLRQVAMPGEASGDARLPSAGDDFEDCLFAQTSFGFARPIRSIEKELVETVASLTREPRSWLVSCQNHIKNGCHPVEPALI